jgi:site-specific DNA-methyltransferase (adenine-specific)
MNITNEDNMKLMARYEDNHFDLAIVDPPYGIGMAKQIDLGNSNKKEKHKTKDWDNEIPSKEYFVELKRVSKNQIIWGGNYFLDYLNATRCFVVWNKENGSNNMADCELAWTSFTNSVRMYSGHIFKGIGNTNYISYHPTQKPVKLYEWLLMNYAQEGDKILDTHLGSGSIAIACHNLKYDLTACELNKEYFETAMKRLEQHTSQLRIC